MHLQTRGSRARHRSLSLPPSPLDYSLVTINNTRDESLAWPWSGSARSSSVPLIADWWDVIDVAQRRDEATSNVDPANAESFRGSSSRESKIDPPIRTRSQSTIAIAIPSTAFVFLSLLPPLSLSFSLSLSSLRDFLKNSESCLERIKSKEENLRRSVSGSFEKRSIDYVEQREVIALRYILNRTSQERRSRPLSRIPLRVTPDGNIIIVAVMRAQKAEQGCRIIRAWKSAFPSDDRIPIGALCFHSRRRPRAPVDRKSRRPGDPAALNIYARLLSPRANHKYCC